MFGGIDRVDRRCAAELEPPFVVTVSNDVYQGEGVRRIQWYGAPSSTYGWFGTRNSLSNLESGALKENTAVAQTKEQGGYREGIPVVTSLESG